MADDKQTYIAQFNTAYSEFKDSWEKFVRAASADKDAYSLTLATNHAAELASYLIYCRTLLSDIHATMPAVEQAIRIETGWFTGALCVELAKRMEAIRGKG
jgi:hypothetical protein